MCHTILVYRIADESAKRRGISPAAEQYKHRPVWFFRKGWQQYVEAITRTEMMCRNLIKLSSRVDIGHWRWVSACVTLSAILLDFLRLIIYLADVTGTCNDSSAADILLSHDMQLPDSSHQPHPYQSFCDSPLCALVSSWSSFFYSHDSHHLLHLNSVTPG